MDILKPNTTRGNNAVMLIYIVITANLLRFMASIFGYNILTGNIFPAFNIDQKIGISALSIFIPSLLVIISYIVSIVFFILWFRRAYYNLHVIYSNLSYTHGLAAGSWFLPFANLYIPYKIMSEIWKFTFSTAKESNNELEDKPHMVGIWWGAWITTLIITNIIDKMADNGQDIESYTNLCLGQIIISFLFIILGFYTVYMIKNSIKIETIMYENHNHFPEPYQVNESIE